MKDTLLAEQQLDQKIIELTQAGLPLVSEPYKQLADELDISSEQLMLRLETMQQDGRIRRIGAVPNHYRLGYKANGMSVWDVDDCFIRTAGKEVGALAFVSHCYHRPRKPGVWPYNLFAMVHGHTQDEVFSQVVIIKALLGDRSIQHDVLFSTRILKKTGFRTGKK